jgi:zinc transporter ZupT
MNLLDILLHLLNFVAPALALAVLLPLLSRLFTKRQARLLPWWGQVLLNFVVGVAALLAALWLLGRDGKMAGYAALVLAVATSQWVLVRGWRR